MSKNDVKPLRPWRELAKATAEEHDPNEVLKLAQELIRSLDAECSRAMVKIHQDDKVHGEAQLRPSHT